MSSYEEHCRNLGNLAEILVDVVKDSLPLQTFKDTIDSKSNKILQEVHDEMTSIGNDGLNAVVRAQRPPCAILLGTSSAGKTEILGSFLPKLREFAGSTARDTTPMLVRMRYPKDDLNPADHGRVTFLMPRDLVQLMSNLPSVKNAFLKDAHLGDSWDLVTKIQRDPNAVRDAVWEKKLYTATREWIKEAYQWAKTNGNKVEEEYFETLGFIADHFNPDAKSFERYNPIPRNLIHAFLDKGEDNVRLSKTLQEKMSMAKGEADENGKNYYNMRTAGAITDLFVEEEILKDIDIYDTAGVRVGGDDSDTLKPSQKVHSQIQAFKNRWGFERLIPSVDIIIFILVMEEQQVDTEFQALFDECRKYGNLDKRLFIFLNKLDKAVTQAVNKKDYNKGRDGEVVPDEEKTWKIWVETNVMDKIRGLGDTFRNVFLCHAPKFKIDGKEEQDFLLNSTESSTLKRYLYDVNKNVRAALADDDGGIKFAWETVERVMRKDGSEIRYGRLGKHILPYAKDVLNVLGAKRVAEEKPTDKEIDAYLEKLLKDLASLNWRPEEFRLPERFGEFCIQKGLCSSKQIEEALQSQKEMLEDTGRKVKIGQILVDKKYMTLEQVREIVQLSEDEEDDWDVYQKNTFNHVRDRVMGQIVSFMEEKGRPIIKGNVPVEAVIRYLTEPVTALEEELKGIYTNNERKQFQEAIQNVMECQLLACLWNQDRLRKYLWDQKSKITSSFDIRDDISKEEAIKVTESYKKLNEVYEKLPALS